MSDDTVLVHAQSDEDLRACFPVMRELRPRLADAQAFVDCCRRMQPQGYRLLSVRQGDAVLALAGYRVQENLIYGRFLYVDDLVAAESFRRHGWGARLLQELAGIARGLACSRLVLDTGLANSLAQRFYFRQGLLTGAMRFSMALDGGAP